MKSLTRSDDRGGENLHSLDEFISTVITKWDWKKSQVNIEVLSRVWRIWLTLRYIIWHSTEEKNWLNDFMLQKHFNKFMNSLKIYSQSVTTVLCIFSICMNNFICSWNFRQFDSFISDQGVLMNMENSKNNHSILQTSIPFQIRVPISIWVFLGTFHKK